MPVDIYDLIQSTYFFFLNFPCFLWPFFSIPHFFFSFFPFFFFSMPPFFFLDSYFFYTIAHRGSTRVVRLCLLIGQRRAFAQQVSTATHLFVLLALLPLLVLLLHLLLLLLHHLLLLLLRGRRQHVVLTRGLRHQLARLAPHLIQRFLPLADDAHRRERSLELGQLRARTVSLIVRQAAAINKRRKTGRRRRALRSIQLFDGSASRSHRMCSQTLLAVCDESGRATCYLRCLRLPMVLMMRWTRREATGYGQQQAEGKDQTASRLEAAGSRVYRMRL